MRNVTRVGQPHAGATPVASGFGRRARARPFALRSPSATLAGRTREETPALSWTAARCDGWSAFLGDDCLATWQPGPRRLYDPDIALVNDRRMQTGGLRIRYRYRFLQELKARHLPFVLVRPPYPYRWAYEPKQLVHGACFGVYSGLR